ncbi:MAG: hypothetical protein WDN72_08595 [Alphaproteobacteria bacterium]
MRKAQEEWRQAHGAIEGVRHMEQRTMMIPSSQRDQGYHRIPALEGYGGWIGAFQALDPNLTPAQHAGLDKVSSIIDGMRQDWQELGNPHDRARPSSRRVDDYVAKKMQELETRGETYMLGGHDTHFNIVRIKRQPDGSYTETLYDSGHETNVVGHYNDRAIVNAVEEHALKPGVGASRFIRANLDKILSPSDSPGLPQRQGAGRLHAGPHHPHGAGLRAASRQTARRAASASWRRISCRTKGSPAACTSS